MNPVPRLGWGLPLLRSLSVDRQILSIVHLMQYANWTLGGKSSVVKWPIGLAKISNTASTKWNVADHSVSNGTCAPLTAQGGALPPDIINLADHRKLTIERTCIKSSFSTGQTEVIISSGLSADYTTTSIKSDMTCSCVQYINQLCETRMSHCLAGCPVEKSVEEDSIKACLIGRVCWNCLSGGLMVMLLLDDGK